MSSSSQLFRLQQIDTLLDQTLARLEELEKLLSDQSTVEQAEASSKKVEAALLEVTKKLHQAENNVRDQRIKLEQDESSLYSGKMHNPKELQDLQNEVAALKRFLTTLEDRQIEIMIAAEEAEAEANNAKSIVAQTQAKMVEQNAHLNAEKTKLLKEKERLEVEWKVACAAIMPQDLDLYNQLRKTRRGIAVTKVVDRTCTACGSTLTPALVQAANSPGQFVRCPSCSRILYPG
jgi:predicted  nucleic acid-binding Zn-ribbon protein